MENENKCFFSISLENGIIITGANPNEVKDFLTDINLCICDSINTRINKNNKEWKEYLSKLRFQIEAAWQTIYNNQNN